MEDSGQQSASGHSGKSEEENTDPSVQGDWTDFVVVVDQENWVRVLDALYSAIDSTMLPHFRFDACLKGYGLAIRFLAREDSKTVDRLSQLAKDLKVRYSVNPKKKMNDPLRECSGWYDTPESFDMAPEWANLLHQLSGLAMLALKTGFANSGWRTQVVHQFCNMMAMVDVQYLSLFTLKSK